MEKGDSHQLHKERKPIDIIFDGLLHHEKNYDVAQSAGVSLQEYGQLRNQIFQTLKPQVSEVGGFYNFARSLKRKDDREHAIKGLDASINNKEEKLKKLNFAVNEKEKQIGQLKKDNYEALEDVKSLKEQ